MADLAANRRMRILELLEERQSVSTAELSQDLGVSEMTIRRDLADLEKSLALKRTYGGATLKYDLGQTSLFALRSRLHVAEKKAIAKKAIGLVKEGETIFLDASSTCYYFAQEIKQCKGLTIVTNSPLLTWELMTFPAIKVICLGGTLRHQTGSLVGPETEELLLKLHADKLFIAVKGISLEAGLTEDDTAEAQVKRNKIKASTEVILLSDHSKFGGISLIQVAPLESVSCAVVDTGVGNEYLEPLRARGIKVIIAD